jgi:hypothetical protein
MSPGKSCGSIIGSAATSVAAASTIAIAANASNIHLINSISVCM